MSRETIIAWTDHTFNIAWGCEKISPGCAHCYADSLSARYGHRVWGKGMPRRTFGAKHWAEPLAWDRQARDEGRRHRVFCSSMTDWALDDPIIEGERPKMWELIRRTPHLDWQLLTKRADRIIECLPEDWGREGYPNVWLGVSVESQDYAPRLNHLTAVNARVHFVSAEPLLGPLDLRPWFGCQPPRGSSVGPLNRIDWVIVGGESGPGHRPMDHDWARLIRDHCSTFDVAFFFKQSSAYRTEMGIELDGRIIREFPDAIPQPR